MSHSWTHPWCRSPARDEAVRAAEDGRSGPLPTLEEAIAAVTERRPPEPGGGGNVTGGLRTERVTLEVTHSVPVAKWDWTNILETYRPGESVRVVEEFGTALPKVVEDMAAEINRLDSERDAAIRERDELRSQVQILDEGQPTAPSDLGVWCTAKDLSARCKELAARLVTTAVRASSAETALREIFAQDYTRSAVNGASWKMHDIAEKALQSAPAASGAAGAGVVLPECPFTPESTHTMGWWEAIGKVKQALAAAGVTAKEVGRE